MIGRRTFFASLTALVVAPNVLKRTPRIAAYVPRQDKLFGGLRELVDGGTYTTTFHYFDSKSGKRVLM